MPKKSGSIKKITKKTDFNFQQQFEALEHITADFEAGNYNLETGLKKFEEGLQLAQQLKQYLTTVENQIETIKSKYTDELTPKN
jgi:exodeoxyribonuclease VII small subunit